MLAALHPERADGAVLIAPAAPFGEKPTRTACERASPSRPPDTDGWAKYNQHYWLEHYHDFAQFFFERVLCEPHSTKQIEDAVGWAMETDARITDRHRPCPLRGDRRRRRAVRPRPLPGAGDPRRPRRSHPLRKECRGCANPSGGRLVTIEGWGHVPQARDPRPDQSADPRLRGRACALGLHARANRHSARPRPPQARALFVLADRARPRPPRSCDRGELRTSTRTSDRLAGAASL